MHKEIKQKWVEALRSGKYKQGKGALRTDTTFCCLGVLCDIIASDNWNKNTQRIWEMDQFSGTLPNTIKRQVGLENNNPHVEMSFVSNREKLQKYIFPLPNRATLSYLNDKGVPFEEIATIIDECL